MRWGTVPALGVALVALLAVGPFLPAWAVFMLTVAFAKALVVLGLVIMMRAGLVSFGQGLFYGLGAYAAGLAANFFGLDGCAAARASRRRRRRRDGLRPRLRDGALSRDFLRDAEPCPVDDPLRNSRALGRARLDRRLQPVAAEFLRLQGRRAAEPRCCSMRRR